MEKYKDSDVELMSILLKLQEQTSPIRMSIGYTVGGTVRQGIILYEAAPKVIETLRGLAIMEDHKARQQPQKRHTHQRDGAKKAAPPSIRLASL